MKKHSLIKILFCIIIMALLCFSVGALGENPKNAEIITEGKPSSVTFNEDEDGTFLFGDYYFKFIPSETAEYEFSVLNPSSDVSLEIRDASGKYVSDSSYNQYTEEQFGVSTLKANNTYYIVVSSFKAGTFEVSISKHKHTLKTTDIDKAEVDETDSYSGSYYIECSRCDYGKYYKISEVKTIKLSAVKFVYDGKVKKPSLTVKTADGKMLKAGKDYAVSGTTVSNKIGIYSVKLSFKGNYKGSRTLVWKIIPQAPKNVKSVSTQNSITLTWNKVEGAFGYVICDDMGIKVAAVKTNKAVIKGLCEGERATYYIIATAKSGKQTVLGEKTKISTAAKPSTIEYVKAAAKKNQVTVSWYENHGVSGYQVSFSAKKNGTYKTLKTVKANPKKNLSRVTLSKFSKGTFYFKVRSYIKIGSNIIYGNWSAPVAVKIK